MPLVFHPQAPFPNHLKVHWEMGVLIFSSYCTLTRKKIERRGWKKALLDQMDCGTYAGVWLGKCRLKRFARLDAWKIFFDINFYFFPPFEHVLKKFINANKNIRQNF